MTPFVLSLIGGAIRAALQAASGGIGVWGSLSDDDTKEIVGAAGFVLSCIWSAIVKRKDEQRRAVAQASPAKLTLNQIDEKIALGESPSLMTPKDEIPKLAPAR